MTANAAYPIINDERRTIIAAFWHKGRRAYVEWLAHELARRLGSDPMRLHAILSHMEKDGLLDSRPSENHGTKSWIVTPFGQQVMA